MKHETDSRGGAVRRSSGIRVLKQAARHEAAPTQGESRARLNLFTAAFRDMQHPPPSVAPPRRVAMVHGNGRPRGEAFFAFPGAPPPPVASGSRLSPSSLSPTSVLLGTAAAFWPLALLTFSSFFFLPLLVSPSCLRLRSRARFAVRCLLPGQRLQEGARGGPQTGRGAAGGASRQGEKEAPTDLGTGTAPLWLSRAVQLLD